MPSSRAAAVLLAVVLASAWCHAGEQRVQRWWSREQEGVFRPGHTPRARHERAMIAVEA